jgi:hypothetical protein
MNIYVALYQRFASRRVTNSICLVSLLYTCGIEQEAQIKRTVSQHHHTEHSLYIIEVTVELLNAGDAHFPYSSLRGSLTLLPVSFDLGDLSSYTTVASICLFKPIAQHPQSVRICLAGPRISRSICQLWKHVLITFFHCMHTSFFNNLK